MKLFFFLLPCLVFGNWQEDLKQKIADARPPSWMIEQIAEDLSAVAPREAAKDRLDQTMAEQGEKLFLVRYRIDGREVSEEYPASKKGHPRLKDMKQSLQDLVECAPLPDLDFIISLDDAMDAVDLTTPVFVFAKSRLHKKPLLLIPDFEALQHTEAVLKEVRKGIEKYPWDKKKSIAFWRGACTGGTFNLDSFVHCPRSKLVALSLSFPKLIDARFTLPVTQSDDPDAVGKKFADYFGASHSIKRHLQYKYQILIDGNTCAFARAYWQLFSNCPIFKQESPNIQWYYRALLPYVHYIPFQTMSELPSKLEWAKKHDNEVEKISRNGQKFASEHLKKSDIYYYLYLLLNRYADKFP